ncbi:LysR family transcriptional regulator [Hyphococcus luteus]|uniref:LysR family transcriptional regulator n=1 Tax=Hyphococcus luteus TaxID=2058213 RepID=A0A2S7K6X8_9PROT|nr:LysR family transcriptional regulator [Marinicaulis flavus]PQA88221.1 LysR family transcriptional regulator [Marinicaulis flavus]
MNWQAIAFDWNQVRAFLATAEEGSFSAAARALRQTQPTLSRQVAALEEELGVTLFERAGRKMMLTAAGMDLLEHVREMGEAATRVSLAASGQAQTVEGRVVITATDGVSATVLPPILKKIRETAPGIQIDIVSTIEIRNIAQREADIAIRHGAPDRSDLMSKQVGQTTVFLCAAKEYLRAFGPVQKLDDLSRADFIGLGRNEDMIEWLRQYELRLTPEQFSISSTSGVVIKELVRQGLGVALMPFDRGLRSEIEPVLPEQFSIPVPVSLTTHRELYASRRIKLVFDILSEELSKVDW